MNLAHSILTYSRPLDMYDNITLMMPIVLTAPSILIAVFPFSLQLLFRGRRLLTTGNSFSREKSNFPTSHRLPSVILCQLIKFYPVLKKTYTKHNCIMDHGPLWVQHDPRRSRVFQMVQNGDNSPPRFTKVFFL